MINRLLVLAIIFCTTFHSSARSFKLGEIIPKVICKGRRDCSYVLYLPSTYDAARKYKYPVLFTMSPSGGNEGAIRRYVKGAEKNGWIVAMSIQSKNGYGRSNRAMKTMVKDIFDRLHVDERRCYASGFSGGGCMAFLLANDMSNVLGIIPCGAGGDAGVSYNGRSLAYGFCGGYCLSRWDMAHTFYERVKKKGRLRFIPGGHVWANENHMFDAITWLNGKYLAKKGKPEEIQLFSEMLMQEIENQMDYNPYFAYENCVVLASITKGPYFQKSKKVLAQLESNPKVKQYIDGLEDIEDFVDKHFNIGVSDYQEVPQTSTQKKDAAKLLAKYAETPLAPVIRDLGRASERF